MFVLRINNPNYNNEYRYCGDQELKTEARKQEVGRALLAKAARGAAAFGRKLLRVPSRDPLRFPLMSL